METEPQLEGLDERAIFESMQPNEIVDYILDRGKRVAQIERMMSLASEVLEGGYGLTVDEVLQKRENKDEQT